MQVADRWHLVHNLQEALVRLIERNGKQLKDAAKLLSSRPEAAQQEASPAPCLTATVPKVSTRLERQQAQRRAVRLQVYQQVVELHQQKVHQREFPPPGHVPQHRSQSGSARAAILSVQPVAIVAALTASRTI